MGNSGDVVEFQPAGIRKTARGYKQEVIREISVHNNMGRIIEEFLLSFNSKLSALFR